MADYISKPVAIQAMAVRDLVRLSSHGWGRLPSWFVAAYNDGRVAVIRPDGIDIRTPHGAMSVPLEDWLICDGGGVLRSCDGAIFESAYEAAAAKVGGEG